MPEAIISAKGTEAPTVRSGRFTNESDKQDTSEQLKQQSGEKSGETAFLSASSKDALS